MNAPTALGSSRVTAVLGPTNTGKTHYAIERMLGHKTGVIGLPLRLLAREVYDRIVRLRGPSVVALVTGEERIVPPRTQYWVCTVEAMPDGMGCDFLAIDEIQLCADPERGHVFTDRLFNARGTHETLLLGAETMRPAIAALVPNVTFIGRERFSKLTYTGSKKLSRMPERSAIVGFSVENVYAIAELLRRQKGGAAVVMGALSPRTRNAQVEMYQSGDVDYLVATDAIGMGLNLDISHVAFSGLAKFDGTRMRELAPDELAQIAGRAGRHMAPGTFGVTGEAPPLDDEIVSQIENHQFRPVTRLMWRNSDLQFGSPERLIRGLEQRTENSWLGRVRESDDLAALKALAADAEVRARASDGPSVRLLWDVCRIPDFRGISRGEHAVLLAKIYNDLHERGSVPTHWFAEQVQRIDRTEGDIDTLSKRLAYIRTWTYVAQRSGWVGDESHWREETRAVEDRLSDALHAALMQRFVDRRTSVLARRLRQKESLVAEVNDKGEVTVEQEFVGRLVGFRFRVDKSGNPDEARTLRQAAAQALAPQFSLRADRLYNAPDTEMDFTDQGGLMWGSDAVGKLVKGPEPLRPGVVAFVDEEAGPEVVAKVQRRLQHFIDRKITALMEPLLALQNDAALTGLAKGFAYRLVEAFGVLPRGDVAEDVRALDQEARAALRKHGIRFGQFTVFLPPLLKPAPTRLRLVLWALSKGLDEFPDSPPAGHVTVAAAKDAPPGYYAMAGYRAAGTRAIRIDMLERLADLLRDKDSRGGFEAVPDMLSITGLSLDGFAELMGGLGYRAEKGERPKQKVRNVEAEPTADVVAASDIPDVPPSPEPSAPDAPPEVPEPPADPDVPDPQQEPPIPDVPTEDPPAPDSPDVPQEDPTPVGPDVPDNTPPEMPVEEPPLGVPPSGPSEMPGDIPMEMPPMDTPTEMPTMSAEGGIDGAAEGTAEVPADAGPTDEGPVEVESFYTFTWSGRANRREQGQRQGQGQGRRARGPRAEPAAADAPAAAPTGDRPKGRRRDNDGPKRDGTRSDGPRTEGNRADGKPRDGEGFRKNAKGGKPPRRDDREDRNAPRTFEARPARDGGRDKRIDPDNPFAAALAGFKAK